VNRDYRGKTATRKEYFISESVLAQNRAESLCECKKRSKFLRKIENRKRGGRPVTKHGAIDASAFMRGPRKFVGLPVAATDLAITAL
jgi:hypothetical protein